MKFISKQQAHSIQRRLTRLYGDRGSELMERFHMLLGRYGVGEDDPPAPRGHWDENDVVLITYADMVQSREMSPLKALTRFCMRHLKGAVSTVHILPFSPWTSDDGFSVVDYRQVEKSYGSWRDLNELGEGFSLMYDLVLNHCSVSSQWFKDYVTGIAPACFYFLPMDPETDLSAVVRPRPWPLLTPVHTRDGEAHVWTTFSADQVDLNWQNPDVLFEFLDILFLYFANGCRILRLDAIAFLWKEIGTSCVHLPETHEIVKLFRDVFDLVRPEAVLLTETNVPHEENISYFGHGDEAHMVYNFSLPPLLLHGLLRQDSTHLTAWAKSLPDLPHGQTFLNFTSSHDGIGVRPLQGILDEAELDWVVKEVKARGGRVSMRAMGDGTEKPYELNITYCDALSVPGDLELGMARFLCSQALTLAFRGMPAVYFHCLAGTPNWEEGVAQTQHNRTINRRKFEDTELRHLLLEDGGNDRMARIFARYQTWLRRRRNHPAFHPDAPQKILDLGSALFGFTRTGLSKGEHIVCVFNFTPEEQRIAFKDLDERLATAKSCRDILNATTLECGGKRTLKLGPYHAYWLIAR